MATISVVEESPSGCGHIHATIYVDGVEQGRATLHESELQDPPSQEALTSYARTYLTFERQSVPAEQFRGELAKGIISGSDEAALAAEKAKVSADVAAEAASP